jgi:hypothetical protein
MYNMDISLTIGTQPMITELTPEQEDQLHIFGEKWYKIGTSTAPSNRQQAENGIHLLYKQIGLKPPKEIMWFNSPKTMHTNIADHTQSYRIIKLQNNLILATLREMNIDNTFLQAMIHRMFASYRNKTHKSIYDNVTGSLPKRGRFQVLGEGTWLYIIPLLDFMCQTLELKREAQAIVGLIKILKHSGGYVPLDDVCYISERPTALHLDDKGYPHCDDGLAIGYPDGWGVYAWHGVRISEYVIMRPHEITPQGIVSEDNHEVATSMLERYGEDRFMKEGGFRIIERDRFGHSIRNYYFMPSDQITPEKIMAESNVDVIRVMLERYGQEQFLIDGGITITEVEGIDGLYQVEFKNDDESVHFLRIQHGRSKRNYYITVPPHIRSDHDHLIRTILGEDIVQHYPDHYAYFT